MGTLVSWWHWRVRCWTLTWYTSARYHIHIYHSIWIIYVWLDLMLQYCQLSTWCWDLQWVEPAIRYIIISRAGADQAFVDSKWSRIILTGCQWHQLGWDTSALVLVTLVPHWCHSGMWALTMVTMSLLTVMLHTIDQAHPPGHCSIHHSAWPPLQPPVPKLLI